MIEPITSLSPSSLATRRTLPLSVPSFRQHFMNPRPDALQEHSLDIYNDKETEICAGDANVAFAEFSGSSNSSQGSQAPSSEGSLLSTSQDYVPLPDELLMRPDAPRPASRCAETPQPRRNSFGVDLSLALLSITKSHPPKTGPIRHKLSPRRGRSTTEFVLMAPVPQRMLPVLQLQ